MRGRVEDDALLRGRDRYAGDMRPENLLHARIIRSTVAHGVIRELDISDALKVPGVVAIFLGDDLGVGPAYFVPPSGPLPPELMPPPVATHVVRYVGEILGVAIAETPSAAADAAELVMVDYEMLPVVPDIVAAMDPGAALLFPDFGSNVAMDVPFEAGEHPSGDLVRVELDNANHRMAVAPMEPNAVTVVPDVIGGRLTAWVSTQAPHAVRDMLASALAMERDDVRVVAPAVGGGFGGKISGEEYVLMLAAARKLGRPVQYVQSRSENLVTMNGRGSYNHIVLEATRDGRLCSLQVDMRLDAGAYPGVGIGLSTTIRNLLPSVYHLPHLSVRTRGIVTNTAPVGAFRGAGRPEAAAIMERAIDRLAVELGIDPVELRRRNLIGGDEFPYTTLTGCVYDSGEYERCLDEAVRLSDYGVLRAEQQRRRRRGEPRALGIGVAMYVEMSAGVPSFFDEYGAAEIDTDGNLVLTVGTSAHGQGHITTYVQLARATLGIPAERITVVQGDTAAVPEGNGTGSSASGQMGGNAVRAASLAVLEKARALAGHLLEASVDDIEIVEGEGLGVRGVPSARLSWAELATAALDDERRPADMTPGLAEAPGFSQHGGTFPFGCHVAVVEVDTETGAVELVRIVAVDDCGHLLNPMIVEGQVHGGLAAGISHALFEEMRYDDQGTPLTSTFADYAFPSAAEFPSFDTAHTITPSPRNPLGVKGIGEAGTTGATAAVHNAVVDAVAHIGVRHISLPLTPQRVWAAIEKHVRPDV